MNIMNREGPDSDMQFRTASGDQSEYLHLLLTRE
jgi:hypothetical protein